MTTKRDRAITFLEKNNKRLSGLACKIEACRTLSEARQVCVEYGIVRPSIPVYEVERESRMPEWSRFFNYVDQYGGFSNCHGHFGRAFTAAVIEMIYGPEAFHAPMTAKWDMNLALMAYSSVDTILARHLRVVFEGIDSGGTYFCTNVDAEPSVGTRDITAALIVRQLVDRNKGTDDPNRNVDYRFGPHPIRGFFPAGKLDNRTCELYEFGAKVGDFCGGLPSRDGRLYQNTEGLFRDHVQIVFDTAKRYGRGCGIHLDQANSKYEHETWWMAMEMTKQNMQGRVVGVHCVSLSRKTQPELKQITDLMLEAKMGIIVCPFAALSMESPPELTPTNNSIAPFVYAMKRGIPCYLGIDNIGDVYMPMSTPSIISQVLGAFETSRCYQHELIARLATGVPYVPAIHAVEVRGYKRRSDPVIIAPTYDETKLFGQKRPLVGAQKKRAAIDETFGPFNAIWNPQCSQRPTSQSVPTP